MPVRTGWWLAALLVLGAGGGAAEPGKELERARAALGTGRYDEAVRLAKAVATRGGPGRDDADLVAARAEVAIGKYPAAEQRLAELGRRSPMNLEGRILLGRLYRTTGRLVLAKQLWNKTFDDYEQGRIDKGSASQLVAVAVAARYLGSYQDANEVFHDAVAADEKNFVAHLEWADTFLEKYAAGEAEHDAQAALDARPKDADAHVMMARVKLEQSYDVPAANRELAAALEVNPRHAGALAIQAELALDVDDLAGADEKCRLILNVNPLDESAHTLRAAIRVLDDNKAGYEAEKKAVLANNPRASGFFHGVAEVLVKQHRYDEANLLEEEALKVDPDDAVALSAIGQNLLRLGEEQKGHEALKRAFKRDAYNVRTYNLLNLLEEVVPKKYTFVEAPPFRIRVSREEEAVLGPLVTAMVQTEWSEMTRRYGFTPTQPVQIELFADPKHYAVRTVGLPGLEALGVTFGRVVTGRSPSEGRFNWGMMLWHELGHVFSIQRSRSRVPRWFTEGLAEYETALHNPDWRRHTHRDLHAALERGTLLSVGVLNTGFVRARTIDNIVVAYHESAEAVSFLARRWGFPKVVAALELFGKGERTPQVIAKVTGGDVAAFDRAFQADLRQRLKVYDGQFFLCPADWADVETLEVAARARPDDARAQALYALALLNERNEFEKARAVVDKALKLGANSKEGTFAAAMILAKTDHLHGAELMFRRLIELGGDGYDARIRLADLLLRQKKPAEAMVELERAIKLDPELAAPHALLGKLLFDAKRTDEALVHLEAAAHLEVHDVGLLRRLIKEHGAARRWAKVREFAAMAGWIDPYDAEVRLADGRAALQLGDAKAAVATLELALQAPRGPKKTTAALRGLLARSLAATGEVTRARTVAAEALADDPTNDDARKVH